jgi:aspartyl/asparaginyl beta-hydroxylase (cupin superfamily)
MSVTAETVQSVLASAKLARENGRADEAVAMLERLLKAQPQVGPAWNLLGIIHLERGRLTEAMQALRQVVQVDPSAPFGWFNLAKAQRGLGDHAGELQSLDAALARDPYFLPALLAKGETLRELGREPEALELYRLLIEGLGDTSSFPQPTQLQLQEVRQYLQRHGVEQMDRFARSLAEVADRFPDADLSRARAFAENRAGLRKVYQQQPVGGHFPYLPAIEFFDPKLFPWFEKLEACFPEIRTELLSLWAEDDPNFRPYVARPPGTPLNQWQELNHSSRWSAFFLWEDGRRNDANCARCPKTAAAIESVPMLDIPGKGPTAMFSILRPHTRIPPHTGATNARTTIHLGLVIPPHCRFRVGAETREWREGECWAFDDTIEHEAWNDSASPRAILIIDAWNPLLTEVEREAVRMIG